MLNWCFFGAGNSTNVLRRGILTIRVSRKAKILVAPLRSSFATKNFDEVYGMHRVLRQIESVPRPFSEWDG